jgi:hypothetical protein
MMHFSFSNGLPHKIVLTSLNERPFTNGSCLRYMALKHACLERLQLVSEVTGMV